MITVYIADIRKLPPEKRHTAFFLAQVLPELGFTTPPDIARGPQGKPYLLNSPGLFFNGSHSKDYLALAIADTPVGVDIQKILPKDRPKALIRRFMAPQDLADFEACPEGERLRCFYDLWAGKESYIKYLGTGFKTPMARFHRVRTAVGWQIADGGRLQDKLRLTPLRAPEDYVLWVCGHTGDVKIIFREIKEDL